MSEGTPAGGGLPAKVYEDTISPSAKEIGATLGSAVRLALSPANFILRSLQDAVALAEEGVRERFRRWRTLPQDVQPPPPEIAAPVIHALQVVNQDPTLREMYLNLLARAMSSQTAERTHPAFADLLRQLSPMEARILGVLPIADRAIPMVEVRDPLDGNGWQSILKHVTFLGAQLTPPIVLQRGAIDNLVRLGVLAIDDIHHATDEELYRRLETTPEAEAAGATVRQRGREPAFHHYLAEVTEFGVGFLHAVLDEPGEASSPKPPD